MSVLKSFVLGTSILAALPHLIIVGLLRYPPDFSYPLYSVMAPLYFGIMNALGVVLAQHFKWSLRERLFYISLISITFIVALNYFISSRYYKPYSKYSPQEWVMYILRNGVLHLFVFNVILYSIEKLFQN